MTKRIWLLCLVAMSLLNACIKEVEANDGIATTAGNGKLKQFNNTGFDYTASGKISIIHNSYAPLQPGKRPDSIFLHYTGNRIDRAIYNAHSVTPYEGKMPIFFGFDARGNLNRMVFKQLVDSLRPEYNDDTYFTTFDGANTYWHDSLIYNNKDMVKEFRQYYGSNATKVVAEYFPGDTLMKSIKVYENFTTTNNLSFSYELDSFAVPLKNPLYDISKQIYFVETLINFGGVLPINALINNSEDLLCSHLLSLSPYLPKRAYLDDYSNGSFAFMVYDYKQDNAGIMTAIGSTGLLGHSFNYILYYQ